MNVIETVVWSSVFGVTYDRWCQSLPKDVATRQAIRDADESIVQIRARMEEKGRLHVYDSLEAERLGATEEAVEPEAPEEETS